jgi:hypothetical protein
VRLRAILARLLRVLSVRRLSEVAAHSEALNAARGEALKALKALIAAPIIALSAALNAALFRDILRLARNPHRKQNHIKHPRKHPLRKQKLMALWIGAKFSWTQSFAPKISQTLTWRKKTPPL